MSPLTWSWDEDAVYAICEPSNGATVKVLDRPLMTFKQAIDFIDQLDPNNDLKLYPIHEDALKAAAGRA